MLVFVCIAMNPDALADQDDLLGVMGGTPFPTAAGATSSSSSNNHASNVLRALAEQTERTVAADQSRLGAEASTSSSSGGGGGEGQQMNMIVDVVMQHLLSKDVLYQPMKVTGADSYG
jgi:hypothetical protein